jgi:hypothetical protein
VERFGRFGVGFGGVDPWVAVHPELPNRTGLTGAHHWCDQCRGFVGFAFDELRGSCGFGPRDVG